MRTVENHFYLKVMFLLKGVLGGTAFLFFSLNTVAQGKIDSLEQQLKKDLPAEQKVKTLIALAAEYEYVDIIKAKDLAQEAIDLAEKNELSTQRAEAYRTLGIIYRISGDYRSALRADNISLEIGLINKDSILIAKGYNNLGHDYYDLGEYDEAYHYFIQSYKTGSRTGDSLTMAIALHNVGRVFKEVGQYDRALDHLELSRKLSRQVKDKEGEPYSLDEIGDVLLRQGKYDEALRTLFSSLKESRRQNLRILYPKTMINIAKIYVRKNEFETAFAYYDTAYQLYSTTNDKYGIAEVELGRGLAFMEQSKYDQAMKSLQGSLELAQALNANILELQCFQQLSTLWEMRGEYKRSLEYFKKFKQLEDTLFSMDMQGKLLYDQLRFETESRDSKIAALNLQQAQHRSELKKQEFVRNILVVVMALSGILLITVYRSGQRRRKINMLLLQHQEEMERRSEELERLNQVKDKFFSIISHDLRSPINALAGMLDLLDKGAVKVEELPNHVKELKTRFHHTRTLLNNLLDWTLLQMDKLNLQATRIDLHKLVEENIQLLEPIQGKEIEIINAVHNPAIGFADSNTINLVIRNLMTNAIKFTNEGGKVVVAAKENGQEWLVSVQDNGVGIKPDVLKILFDKTAPYTTRGTANEKGTGLGLILCKEFVEKNGGRIWVESEENKGSTFWFTLPKAS
jgi:signal transduction histidine kinase/Tfp pilus assembly protein PilF